MKYILVVDDSETIRMEVGRNLEKAGHSVVEAGDGVEGLKMAKSHELSLVLLDVNMPRMGGMEMLQELKSDPLTKEIPVLMLTTEIEQSMIGKARMSGAVGWIFKPPTMALLVKTVNKLAIQ